MPSENSHPEADLLPFGAPQVDPVDASVRAKLTKASSGKQKIQRNTRAPRLIGLSLWSRSSLSHWKAQEYDIAQTGYEGQMAWTKIGIERWVAHYNRGTTLVRQGQTDEGVTDLRTAFDLVPKATEVKPGRLEPFSYECRVRVNLAIGIEIQGDVQAAAGAYANAATIYQEAEETVAPCQTASNSSQNQSDDQNQSDNKDQSSNQNQSGKQGQSGDQQQSGNQSDNPADQNKERVEDKKQKAEEQSQEQGDQQQDQQQDQQDKGSKDQQTNPSPSPSPSPNPYEGETPEEKQRREELQHKNDQRNKDQRDKKDDRRSGNPNGAW